MNTPHPYPPLDSVMQVFFMGRLLGGQSGKPPPPLLAPFQGGRVNYASFTCVLRKSFLSTVAKWVGRVNIKALILKAAVELREEKAERQRCCFVGIKSNVEVIVEG